MLVDSFCVPCLQSHFELLSIEHIRGCMNEGEKIKIEAALMKLVPPSS